MTPLITRAQGAACRRAAERIAEGGWDGCSIVELDESALPECSAWRALYDNGWRTEDASYDSGSDTYDQSQVLMALLWCAEIAGEA